MWEDWVFVSRDINNKREKKFDRWSSCMFEPFFILVSDFSNNNNSRHARVTSIFILDDVGVDKGNETVIL